MANATVIALRIRLALQSRLVDDYQPDPFQRRPGRLLREADGAGRGDPRASEERFAAFASLLPADVPLSVLDVGCNEGFFLFKLAGRGGLCIGIDLDPRGIMIGKARATVNGVDNVVFSQFEVDRRNVAGLPRADVVLCLSVFHHWVRYRGLDEAHALLSSVAERADRHFVFETGQSDELGAKWTDDLAFMGDDPEGWVHDTLTGLGFDQIRVAGRFPTTVSPFPRTLFVASRADAGDESAEPV